MRFMCGKLPMPERDTMLCVVLLDLPKPVLALLCQCDVIMTLSTCYRYSSRAVAHLSACMCQIERRIQYNTILFYYESCQDVT